MFLPRCAASIALFVIPLLTASAPATAEPSVWYVNASATGSQSGTSWASAFVDLQDALAAATAGDEIWVARGEYRPAGVGGDRTASFQLKSGVGVYGGFIGNEVTRSERDALLHETVLSGDLNGDDFPANPTSNCCFAHDGPGCDDPVCEDAICPSMGGGCCTDGWSAICAGAAGTFCDLCATTGNNTDNSLNVVRGSGTNATAVLDGFTIRGGNAQTLGNELGGGGMLNIAGSPTVLGTRFVGNVGVRGGGMLNSNNSHPRVENCTFAGNRGGLITFGAGMMNQYGSDPTIINCQFLGNDSSGTMTFGAGLTNFYHSSPMIVGCLFSGGRGYVGCAIHNDVYSSPQVVNCRFVGGRADFRGGAIINFNYSVPVFVNCLFSGNTAGEAGGAVFDTASASSRSINCSFFGNSRAGGVVGTNGLTPTIINSVFFGNVGGTSDFAHEMNMTSSAIEAQPLCCALNGSGNITLTESPFVDPVGADGVVGTPDDDLRLWPGTPCSDAANNLELPADVADLDGDGDLTELTPLDLIGEPRFQDDPGTPDTGVGIPPLVDMGALEYGLHDCNGNGIDDLLDVADGTSADCNANLIPDECEGAVCIASSTPSVNSIDSRQPLDDEGAPNGWQDVMLVFNTDLAPIAPGAFRVTSDPPGEVPVITSLDVQGLTVTLHLDRPIRPGAWTTFRHRVSGTQTRLGYLPGDVDGDGRSSGVDVLRLIDAINQVGPPLPESSTDIDRSGQTNPADVLREIEVLSNCEPWGCWWYATLPEVE